MKNITYISAGAGSGKTYHLTHEVVRLFAEDKDFKPEQLILTTFTKKAAAELMNEVRKILCEKGEYDLSAQLDNALIGTVHSIGYQLVNKYWYYCNASPMMNILEENALKDYINSTLVDCVTDEDMSFFNKLLFDLNLNPFGSQSSNPFDWKSDVKKIIENAHNFGVVNFEESLQTSINLIRSAFYFDDSIKKPNDLKLSAIEALEELEKKCEAVTRKNQINKAQRILKEIPNLINSIEETSENSDYKGRPYFALYDFMNRKDTKVEGDAYVTENIENLKTDLSKLRYEPEYVLRYEEYVRRVFKIAENWKSAYIEYKEKNNVLDYNDIERKFIELLENEEVLLELKSEYRYLMVDEFQDSNSNQIKIFRILADNLKHTYWVGDKKQAIYAFRGSNTKLIERITTEIHKDENGCDRFTLKESHRSVPKLVEFSNAIFSQAFRNLNEDITLNPVKEANDEIEPLVCLKMGGRTNDEKFTKVASYVSQIINDTVYGEYSKDLSNFAILARNDNHVQSIADALRKLNIPVSVSVDYKGTIEFKLLKAVLTLCEDNNNNLAKAIIAYLTSSDYPLNKIIDDKISFDNSENNEIDWLLDKLPLIDKIVKFSKYRKHMGVGAYVCAIISEIGLDNYSSFWKEGDENVWEQMKNAALEYEAMCSTLGKPATLHGYLKSDSGSSSTDLQKNAIQVMTYHKSKGLGWPVVLLLSLDDDISNEKDIIDKEILGVRVEESVDDGNKIVLFPSISSKRHHDTVIENLRDNIENAKNKKLDEEKRLLYVGVTRAKDQLVLITHNGSLQRFKALNLEDSSMLPEPVEVTHNSTEFKKENVIFPVNEPEKDFKTESNRYIAPSSALKEGKAKKIADIGQRINGIKADDENAIANFGNCIHQIYCCLEKNHSTELVDSLLEQYEFDELKNQTETIIANWDALTVKLEELYGKASETYHELGFRRFIEGQFVTGSMDLVWSTPTGDVVVDYKTFPGKPSDALDPLNKHYSGNYAGQFHYYREALEDAGRQVLAQLVFYPSIGMLVQIEEE